MDHRSTRAFVLPAAMLAGSLLVAACKPQQQPAPSKASDAAAPKPVATVDGVAIPRQVYDFYAKNLAQKPVADLNAEQKNQILDALVSTQILANVATKSGVDKDPDVAAQLELGRLRLLADAVTQRYLKDKDPTEQEMRVEYETALTQMDKTEYKTRHILVATEGLAQDLLKRLKSGAKFEDLAKQNSTDAGSAAKGGELPPLTANSMAKPFAEAVKQLKKGEVTPAPVHTEFGWHIIQLLGTGDVKPPAYESVKPQLARQILQKRLYAYVEELKKTVKIERSL
jgi:peptidyl-prolyl cis-trans isomerase C